MAVELDLSPTAITLVPSQQSNSSSSHCSTPSSGSPIATPPFPGSNGASFDDEIAPKIEELDDGINEAKASLKAEVELLEEEVVTRRPRGRPPKKPLIESALSVSKVSNKVRSKTGCFTCRRRKKKCDEAKPTCTVEKRNIPI